MLLSTTALLLCGQATSIDTPQDEVVNERLSCGIGDCMIEHETGRDKFKSSHEHQMVSYGADDYRNECIQKQMIAMATILVTYHIGTTIVEPKVHVGRYATTNWINISKGCSCIDDRACAILL